MTIAACSCGQLAVSCAGAPARVSVCHCLACKRRTGSAFGAQARYEAHQVTVSGESTSWERVGDGGSRVTFRFCPRCGSTVFWTLDAVPGVVAVAVGCFADPEFEPPRVSVYEERQCPWVILGDSVREHLG
ncbi:MAG: GFA family protein [Myxococcota bacterium]